MAISEFTLSFLEDSGWYKANYYTGGLFRFGKNQGWQFIENDCLDNYWIPNLKMNFLIIIIYGLQVAQLGDKVELMQHLIIINILKRYIKDIQLIMDII